MLFNLVYVTFCSKKYVLELKFLTHHGSLSSQASLVDVCRIWLKNHRPGFVQTPSQQWMIKTLPVFMHANHISNSAILSNNYISLLSDLCACVPVEKVALQIKPYSSSVMIWSTLWHFKVVKKQWAGVLLSVKYCFCAKTTMKETQSWTNLSGEEEERKKENILAVWQLSGSVLSWCFFVPLGMLL